MAEQLTFPPDLAAKLEPHLPPRHPRPSRATPTKAPSTSPPRPFVTLTYATSLDSAVALAPGVRTRLSGPESKAMTHHLRSRHAAILVGVSTVLADDPALNCRIAPLPTATTQQQPRPVVIDPRLRWQPRPSDRVLETCRRGAGLAPYVVTAASAVVPAGWARVLEEHGGKYIHVVAGDGRGGWLGWADVFGALAREGLGSVMVEGGGRVISSLLGRGGRGCVDSVVVTVAPTWLGRGAVVVAPERGRDGAGEPVAAARLGGVLWLPLGEDVVLCGRLVD